MVIVWAEDDETERSLIESALGETTKIVRFVGDGAAALQAIRAARPKAIVLDVNMPLLDGVETLKRIREDPKLRDLPVVMFSSSLHRQKDCQQLGAKFIEKPAKYDRFIAAVQSVEEFARAQVKR